MGGDGFEESVLAEGDGPAFECDVLDEVCGCSVGDELFESVVGDEEFEESGSSEVAGVEALFAAFAFVELTIEEAGVVFELPGLVDE